MSLRLNALKAHMLTCSIKMPPKLCPRKMMGRSLCAEYDYQHLDLVATKDACIPWPCF